MVRSTLLMAAMNLQGYRWRQYSTHGQQFLTKLASTCMSTFWQKSTPLVGYQQSPRLLPPVFLPFNKIVEKMSKLVTLFLQFVWIPRQEN